MSKCNNYFMCNCLLPILISFVGFNFNYKLPAEADSFMKTDSLPIKSFIFKNSIGFKQCHASTVLYIGQGDFLTAWFGGTKEGTDDVSIWISRGNANGWSKPFEVAKIDNEPHWNPVLFRMPNGKIYLFFKVGKEISHWKTWYKVSDDNGWSWSNPLELVPNDSLARGPVRNKPILLSNGAVIAGTSDENGYWRVFFDRAFDNGKTWELSTFLTMDDEKRSGHGIIQPTLWEYPEGYVHALLRSSSGFVWRTDSDNFGDTWSKPHETNLPNPNSALDLVSLGGDTLILACNTDSHDWGSRGILTLRISFDNGITWPKEYVIESGNEMGENSYNSIISNKSGDEFSYPAIIYFEDKIAVTYTWQRKRIAFWTGSKEMILKNSVPVSIR